MVAGGGDPGQPSARTDNKCGEGSKGPSLFVLLRQRPAPNEAGLNL